MIGGGLNENAPDDRGVFLSQRHCEERSVV